MEFRELGRTGWKVCIISFGAWRIGGYVWRAMNIVQDVYDRPFRAEIHGRW